MSNLKEKILVPNWRLNGKTEVFELYLFTLKAFDKKDSVSSELSGSLNDFWGGVSQHLTPVSGLHYFSSLTSLSLHSLKPTEYMWTSFLNHLFWLKLC